MVCAGQLYGSAEAPQDSDEIGNVLPIATAAPTPRPSPPALSVLPRGGRIIFPKFRVVAFYGAADTPALGVLGEGSPDRQALRLAKQANAYVGLGRPILPAFELITVEASYASGDGTYSMSSGDETVARYLAAARRAKVLLVLDIQPGRGEFLPRVKRYARFLAQPDVGLALDPEWKMGPDQIPAKVLGHTDAAAINEVSAYLAGIVKRHHLPQKLLIIHQFTPYMVLNKSLIVHRPGVAITFHIDGFGSRAVKLAVYHSLCKSSVHYFTGIKLFYEQDIDIFSAREVVSLKPSPDLITYQ